MFNAVELLDVNFLNPAGGSIASIAKIWLANIYAAGFSIAISFFFVASLVMGIKLAFSTIASEKAKYKEAVMDWVTGLVLMFAIHFVISFIFYLNEELVKIASGIATEAMAEAVHNENLRIEKKSESQRERASEIMDKFIKQMSDDDWDPSWAGDFDDSAGDHDEIEGRAWVSKADHISDYDGDLDPDELNSDDVVAMVFRNQRDYVTGAVVSENVNWDLGRAQSGAPHYDQKPSCIERYLNGSKADKYRQIAVDLLSKDWYVEARMSHMAGDLTDSSNENGMSFENRIEYIYLLIYDADNVVNKYEEFYDALLDEDIVDPDDLDGKLEKYAEKMLDYIEDYHKSAEQKTNTNSLIYNLAGYFKEYSYGIVGGGDWGHASVIIQNVIMYGMLVVQSFMFLIAYLKRVFYVIILSLLAPLVIIYDFFNKSFKGKGTALANWLKEFCTLVFIQTIQAFIYAFTISLILSINFGGISRIEDRNSGIGILAVIALGSVFKVEALVKKIIGFENSKADVKGAMSSLAKTAIAWQFGKRVLDNGAKVAGGIGAIRGSKKAQDKLNSRMKRDLSLSEGGAGGASSAGSGSSGGAAGSGGSGSSGGSGKAGKDYNAMLDNYHDKLDELKKQRRDGIKQIVKGVGETAGAIPGALSGALIGGAGGELDDAIRGASVGAGIGDTLGGAAATSAYDIGSTLAAGGKSAVSGVEAAAKIRAAVRAQQIEGKGWEKAKNVASAYYKEATKNRASSREIEDMIRRANDANADNAN